MGRSSIVRICLCLALLAAAGFALSACGGGGSSGSKGEKDLYLKRFLLVDNGQDLNNLGGTGTTNAYRDTAILFVFNTNVDLKSVTSRTIRIGIPVGNNLFLEAPGRFRYVTEPSPTGEPITKRNLILFEPIFTKHNVSDTADNPFGLDANARYDVTIADRLDEEVYVRNEFGDGIVKSFFASFNTSDEYQQNLKQPELIETSPTDGEIDVPAAADVVLNFTEPMRPDSFKLGTSIIVRNLSIDRDVLGSLRFSSDAKMVIFRPVFGYGKGPSDIFVRVTTAATNLPGNPIPKEVRLQFRSVFDPSQFNQGDIEEPFDDNIFEDTGFANQFPLADWNKGVTSGFLAGVFTTGIVTLAQGSNTYSWPPWAWGQNYVGRWQAMTLSGDIGTARTITGFDWYKNCRASQTVSAVSVNMGHTTSGSMTTNLAGNFSDTPVTVVNNLNAYTISNVPQTGWTPGPTFTQNFKYNGIDNLILEMYNTCAAQGWNVTWTGLWRINNTGTLQRAAYTLPTFVGPTSPVTRVYYYDTRFHYLIDQSETQSHWYNMGLRSPQFLDVFLEPDLGSQPAGTSSVFSFMGATEDLNNPGTPDLGNTTEWVEDLEKLTGLKFIRFHVTMKGNQTTNTRPIFDRLIFPFVFK